MHGREAQGAFVIFISVYFFIRKQLALIPEVCISGALILKFKPKMDRVSYIYIKEDV